MIYYGKKKDFLNSMQKMLFFTRKNHFFYPQTPLSRVKKMISYGKKKDFLNSNEKNPFFYQKNYFFLPV